MSKRNQVQFSRPEDPKFLKLIKEQIGYKNEPSVDTKVSGGRGVKHPTHTKIFEFGIHFVRLCFVVLLLQRQKLNQEFDDSSDSDDELPQIVVTRTGDLSAEQVEAEKRRIESGKNLFYL